MPASVPELLLAFGMLMSILSRMRHPRWAAIHTSVKTRAKPVGHPREFDRAAVTAGIFLAVSDGTLVVDACKAEGVSRSALNA